MKKIPAILAATALVASVGAYAQPLKNDASPFAVNVPNLRSGFEINVEGSFLKPSNSDLDYGFVVNDSNQSRLLIVKPGTDFGWGVGVGYVFPDSGNDIKLNWREFDDCYHADSGLITGDGLSATSKAHAKFELTEIDLNVGQYIDVGNRLQLRPFAGLRHARVESNLKIDSTTDTGDIVNQISQLTAQAIFLSEAKSSSRFSGIGPQLGADVNYNLGEGIHAMGHLATALLVGKVHAQHDLSGSLLTEETVSSDDVTRIVPTLDAKLGLNYSYTFDCESVFTVEGGYRATQYIDAVDRLSGDNSSERLILGGSSSHIAQDVILPLSSDLGRRTSSVGFSGPYIKLSLKV